MDNIGDSTSDLSADTGYLIDDFFRNSFEPAAEQMLEALSGGSPDRNYGMDNSELISLLNALLPFLSDIRRKKAEKIIKILTLLSVADNGISDR